MNHKTRNGYNTSDNTSSAVNGYRMAHGCNVYVFKSKDMSTVVKTKLYQQLENRLKKLNLFYPHSGPVANNKVDTGSSNLKFSKFKLSPHACFNGGCLFFTQSHI